MVKDISISVIGGSKATPQVLDIADKVGWELATRGVRVVCGGLTDVMKAVCRGAKAAGGTTVGILPDDNPSDPNPYVDTPVCTGLGYARNIIVVKSGQAVIAINGAYETLSEIGSALGGRLTVVDLNTSSFAINNKICPAIVLDYNPVEAVDMAIRQLNKERVNWLIIKYQW